jgi:hypothetical protein
VGEISLRFLSWNQSQSIECDSQDHHGKDDPSDIPPPGPRAMAWFVSEFPFEKIFVVEILLFANLTRTLEQLGLEFSTAMMASSGSGSHPFATSLAVHEFDGIRHVVTRRKLLRNSRDNCRLDCRGRNPDRPEPHRARGFRRRIPRRAQDPHRRFLATYNWRIVSGSQAPDRCR